MPQPFVVVGAVTVLALLLFGLREQTARIPAQPVLAHRGVAAVLLVVQGSPRCARSSWSRTRTC